ncbi:MAG: TIGR03905 family TSCPD domain-containing protein [Tannerellaceae bacterium]|nr:TIGR03905 family TSCPD domain-containing protein [Tannerellaceae bacterium]
MDKRHIAYTPAEVVCSKNILIEAEGTTIRKVTIIGGCNGNTQGLSRLLEGMDIEDAIHKTEGIICGRRGTSCPDQIAQALRKLLPVE